MKESEFLALVKSDPDKANALVATEVMGQCVKAASEVGVEWSVEEHYVNKPDAEEPRWGHMLPLPLYTSMIAPAWQVVEKMHAYDYEYMMEWDAEDKRWFVTIHKHDFETGFSAPMPASGADDELLPPAISLAALKAKGEIDG